MKWTKLPNGDIIRIDEAEDDIVKIWFLDLLEKITFKLLYKHAVKKQSKKINKVTNIENKIIAKEIKLQRQLKRRKFFFWAIGVVILLVIIGIKG